MPSLIRAYCTLSLNILSYLQCKNRQVSFLPLGLDWLVFGSPFALIRRRPPAIIFPTSRFVLLHNWFRFGWKGLRSHDPTTAGH